MSICALDPLQLQLCIYARCSAPLTFGEYLPNYRLRANKSKRIAIGRSLW